MNFKHGHARHRSRTVEYRTWSSIMERCYQGGENFARYGGRGIAVCRRWRKFENFLADMGRRPSKEHSIERIKNNKGYSPANCRWATRLEQAQNKRNSVYIVFAGVKRTAAAWERELGVSAKLVRRRIREGWKRKAALLTPPVHQRDRRHDRWRNAHASWKDKRR